MYISCIYLYIALLVFASISRIDNAMEHRTKGKSSDAAKHWSQFQPEAVEFGICLACIETQADCLI